MVDSVILYLSFDIGFCGCLYLISFYFYSTAHGIKNSYPKSHFLYGIWRKIKYESKDLIFRRTVTKSKAIWKWYFMWIYCHHAYTKSTGHHSRFFRSHHVEVITRKFSARASNINFVEVKRYHLQYPVPLMKLWKYNSIFFMALYDIESEDDSYSFDEFVEYEDRESLRRSRQSLGISVAYVPAWTPQDGFREYFQNWFVKYNPELPIANLGITQEGCHYRKFENWKAAIQASNQRFEWRIHSRSTLSRFRRIARLYPLCWG